MQNPVSAALVTIIAICAALMLIVYPEKLQKLWWNYLVDTGAIQRVLFPGRIRSLATEMSLRVLGLLILTVVVLSIVQNFRSH
jgi:dolichyl-phosphate-mannose--protein O-mannosyl transferase